MPNVPLTQDDIAGIIGESTAPAKARIKELTEEQKEFRRWHPYFSDLSGKYITRHDYDLRLVCLSRGCGVRTVWKVQGMAKCTIHALLSLGILLDQKDGVGLKFDQEGYTE